MFIFYFSDHCHIFRVLIYIIYINTFSILGYTLYPNNHWDKINMIFMDVFSIFKSVIVHVVDFWLDYIFLLLFLTFSFPLVTAVFFNWHLLSIQKKYTFWNDSKIFWTFFSLYLFQTSGPNFLRLFSVLYLTFKIANIDLCVTIWMVRGESWSVSEIISVLILDLSWTNY